MKIAVVIPTYQRLLKLERCLESLEVQSYRDFAVFVYFDNNDQETYQQAHRRWEENLWSFSVTKILNSKQEFVIGSWNHFFRAMFHTYAEKSFDAVLWCVDDVELQPECLFEAVSTMEKHFPDTDGVVGLAQECPGYPHYTFKWYGQCLIGKKFIDRYQDVDYQVCCPDYRHFFQDEEMWMYAQSLQRFQNCPTAILKHYHPSFIQAEKDSTHPLVRQQVIKRDRLVYNERRRRGLVWGVSWERVG